jgi:hypothetical protein
LGQDTIVIKGSELVLPEAGAKVIDVDFAALDIKNSQKALAALASLVESTGEGSVLNKQMLLTGISRKNA